MRKLFLTLLLLTTFLLPASAMDSWQEIAKLVNNSVVPVNSEDGRCTGFVINVTKKYVQSAAHCFSKERIWVDRVVGTVISLDEDKDMMVLEVKELDPAKTALKLASKNPVVMQDVMSTGFGYGFERPQNRAAQISDVAMVMSGASGPFVAVNVAFTPGQSGGPVVDSNGDVVSIVQMGDRGTLGLGVGADTIRERMGRFWSNK